MRECCNIFKLNRIFKCFLYVYLNTRKFCSDTYSIFFKNIFLFIDPVELNLVYDSFEYTFIPYNKNIKYDETRYVFFHKIHRVSYKSFKFYNYGYYYCITNVPLQKSDIKVDNIELAYPPDTIEYLRLTMKPNEIDKEEYIIEIHDKIVGTLMEKFICSILSFSTKEIQLEILLYYYLKYYLNNNDKIISVTIKLELDDDEKEVYMSETLETIYNKLES